MPVGFACLVESNSGIDAIRLGLCFKAKCTVVYSFYAALEIRLSAKEIVSEITSIRDNAKLMQMKEDFINASVALKLALNAFDLRDKSK